MPTQQLRAGKAAETQPALPLPPPAPAVVPPQAPAGEASAGSEDWVLRALEPPPLPGETAPDQAVEPPERPEQRAEPKAVGGPVDSRARRDARAEEVKERLARWEAVHPPKSAPAGRARPTTWRDSEEEEERQPLGKRLAKVAAVLLLVVAAGGGTGWYFVAAGESHLAAAEVWSEFNKDASAANKKYRGQFVQVSGKVKVARARGAARTFFAPPTGTNWGIEFVLPAVELPRVRDGATITVRGRFASRKEGNVLMSNCTLVKVQPGS